MARRWWTLAAVSLGVFMLLLDVTIVNVALPDIQKAFSAGLSDLQWVIDAYSLVLAALLMTAGSIADLAGRRRVFAVGIVLFVMASLMCGFAQGCLFLSIARGVQGIGGAIMYATSLALLSQAFPPEERGTAFGVFGAVTGIAVAIGPVLGGALTSWFSWRWVFFVNLPIGLIALTITLVFVEESRDARGRRPDIPGVLTFSIALASLVFALVRSQPDGWSSPVVIGPIVASVVLLAAFLLVEKRSATPMFDLGLLKVPTFAGGLVAAWAISASLFSLLTYLVIYIQDILGFSALQAGLRVLPLSGAIFVAAAFAGNMVDKVPTRLIIGLGFVLIGVGLFLMSGIETSDHWTHFVPGFIVAGIGAGFINVPLASTAVGVVEQERAGMASGANSTFRQVGIATGVAALGSVFSSRITAKLTDLLSGSPLAGSVKDIASISTGGQPSAVLKAVPPAQRGLALQAAQTSIVAALNEILVIGAALSVVAAVFCLVLIRQQDFVQPVGHGHRGVESDAESVAAVG